MMFGTTVGEMYDRCVMHFRHRVAMRYHDESYTYDQMQKAAYSLANALAKLGLKKGDTTAFLMANCPEYVSCEYALAKIGVIRVPLAVLLTNDDHVYMMNHAECKALIYHEKMAPRVMEMLPRLQTVEHFICISGDAGRVAPGHLHLRTLIQDHPPEVPRVEIDEEDLAGIFFTGGTTGMPKGVMLSHRAWLGTYITEMLELGFGYDEVFAFATPLTHAGGCLMMPIMIRRGVCAILDGFDPKSFLEAVEKYRITSTFVVPTMIYVLLDYPDLRKYDTSSLRNIVYGAAAIAPERLKQAIETFGPIFTQLYGQTEAPMMISALPREEHVIDDPERERRVFSSCGRPTFPAVVRIVDGDGNDVPQGEVGDIICRHINVMTGYLKNPEATAETIRDGWLWTGDMAKMDEEGFLYIVDRSKDMVVSGGFNIFPREIEDVLFEHPAVKGAAVIGVPDEKWGEAVKAIVVLHDGKTATEKELINFVRERKGSLICPKTVEFWEAIPLTNLGKVDKKKIRERYWKGYERRV